MIISIILIVVPFIIIAIYSFSHIDQTHMRIFVNNWYWYLGFFIGLILLFISTNRE